MTIGATYPPGTSRNVQPCACGHAKTGHMCSNRRTGKVYGRCADTRCACRAYEEADADANRT